MFVKIPEEHRNELKKEILDVNLHREKTLSIVLIIIDIIMLYTDTIAYRELRSNAYLLNNIFYTHIVLLIVPLIFLFLLYISKKDIFKENHKYKRIIHLWLNISVLILCLFLSLNTLVDRGQINSFIIAVFCIASMALFSLGERLFIYISTYIVSIIEIYIIRDNVHELFWNILFITLLLGIAVIASSFNFSLYIKNFINQKVILEKSSELDEMYRKVEEALKKRTEELTEANERLICEIKAKHEMEIQFIKARHLCEEKEKMLSETVEYDKLRTAFFANLSHELRTPLTIIFSAEQMLDLILRGSNLKDSLEEVKKLRT